MRYVLFLICTVVWFQHELHSQEQESISSTKEILDVAKKSIIDIKGSEIVDGSEVELSPHGPAYSFVDPSIEISSGTLWIWAQEGRPAAIMSLCTMKGRRYFEFRSFSPNKLKFAVLGSIWSPPPSRSPVEIPNAPGPQESEQRRLSQMKQLIGRFRSSEIMTYGTVELRVLPTPIYRYPNSTSESDGAVFTIVRDGDPEAVLVIETKNEGWQFLAGTMTANSISIYLDERRFELTEKNGMNSPYFFKTRMAESYEK